VVIVPTTRSALSLPFLHAPCSGCLIFGWLVTFRIVTKAVYRPTINLKGDWIWAWDYANKDKTPNPAAPLEHVLLPGQTAPSPVDLIRKNRFETEFKNKDTHRASRLCPRAVGPGGSQCLGW
jgi:hypothetical protein